MNEPARIEFAYWTDPLCIWAYVAQARLDKILSELGDSLMVDHRVVPVFGSVPWRFREGPWAKEGVEGRCAATRRIAKQFGYDDVDGECWRNTPASSFAPGAAIKAVFALAQSGELEPARAADYQWQLRRAFFVERRNTADRAVQLSVAEELGIARAPVEQNLNSGAALAALWEDYQEKERLRIQGSPTYVFDSGRAMLYGNFDYAILHSTVLELVKGLHAGGSAC